MEREDEKKLELIDQTLSSMNQVYMIVMFLI